MGCDIHVFVEYRGPDGWRYVGQYHPGRDYTMFGLLAGVRDESVSPVVEPRGFPPTCSFETWLANMAVRVERDQFNEDDLARLRMAHRLGSDVGHLASPNQDWHTHSWLSGAELQRAVKQLGKLEKQRGENSGTAWDGLVALLRALPDGRMTFFFDN